MENTKISLLYQLEQRKVARLERENRALLERINGLLKKEDDERIELLVADKMRRKLVHLRAIIGRTIKSLELGLNELRTFGADIDEAMNDEENQGAIRPLTLDCISESDRILCNFIPKLNRIPESPIVWSSTSTSKIRSFQKGMNEEHTEEQRVEEIVDEMPLLDTMETDGAGQKNASNSEGGEPTKGKELVTTVAPICAQSVALRQRSSQRKSVLLANFKRRTPLIATPAAVCSTTAMPTDNDAGVCEADDGLPSSSATSVPSTPLSNGCASVSVFGRPKRSSVAKIKSYKESPVKKKMRRGK